MMQLAKPASSLSPAALIAPSNAASVSSSNAATTPFAALLESHHEGQQHVPAPQAGPRALKESAAHDSKPASDKTPDPARASVPDRAVEKQAERNRLNAQREVKQAMNRTVAPPSSKAPAQEPARSADAAAQNAAPEDGPNADDRSGANPGGESTFNPMALLQWISEQTAQPALASQPTPGATQAQELLPAEESREDVSDPPGITPLLSTIKTAADGFAVGGASAWTDKTPGARAGVAGKLPLASGLLAGAASRAVSAAEQENQNTGRSDTLGLGSAPSMGAVGLEGWSKTMVGLAMEISNTAPTPTPKVSAASNVAETNNAPQPLALGSSNNSLVDTTTVSVSLPAPVQSPEFRELLGSQISLLAKDGVQSAELHLNPAEMGPVSVQITLDGTQARVDFGADSAQTRQYIEASLPELASAMRDAGLTLSGGGVSQHTHGRDNPEETDRSGTRTLKVGGDDAVEAVSRPPATTRRVALGGVDLYA